MRRVTLCRCGDWRELELSGEDVAPTIRTWRSEGWTVTAIRMCK